MPPNLKVREHQVYFILRVDVPQRSTTMVNEESQRAVGVIQGLGSSKIDRLSMELALTALKNAAYAMPQQGGHPACPWAPGVKEEGAGTRHPSCGIQNASTLAQVCGPKGSNVVPCIQLSVSCEHIPSWYRTLHRLGLGVHSTHQDCLNHYRLQRTTQPTQCTCLIFRVTCSLMSVSIPSTHETRAQVRKTPTLQRILDRT